jgi:hypothetical protein
VVRLVGKGGCDEYLQAYKHNTIKEDAIRIRNAIKHTDAVERRSGATQTALVYNLTVKLNSENEL